MKIDCADRHMLVLELTDNDMKELEITYRDICVSGNALNTLIKRLLNDSSLSCHKGSECTMYAFPDCQGGCMMFLLFSEKENLCVFETDDTSALIDCFKAVGGNIRVYSWNGRYRVVVSSPTPSALTAAEFMLPVGGCGEALYTDEHWTLLFDGIKPLKQAP
ncbi:MAG: hypothetical protein MJ177_03505 [Clostridia bacterium]|nr:hypothetical protein [Clostridia bacterium]